mgnify:CR=1 FL=1
MEWKELLEEIYGLDKQDDEGNIYDWYKEALEWNVTNIIYHKHDAFNYDAEYMIVFEKDNDGKIYFAKDYHCSCGGFGEIDPEAYDNKELFIEVVKKWSTDFDSNPEQAEILKALGVSVD